MPRPIRISFPQAYYWISNSTNSLRPIFEQDSLAELFVDTLVECITRFDISLYSYSVTPSSYHLFIQTNENNLSESIGWLQTTSSIRINRAARSNGHVFSGRYKAILVSPELYAKQLISVIHLSPFIQTNNTLQPGTRKKLSDYPFSSHTSYCRGKERLEFINYDFLSNFTDVNISIANNYDSYIERICAENAVPNIKSKIRSSLVLGTDELLNRVYREISEKTGLIESKWIRTYESEHRAKQIAEIIPDNTGRDLKIYIRSALGHERPTQLAREFGFSDTSGITHLLNKIRRQSKTDEKLAAQIASLTSEIQSRLNSSESNRVAATQRPEKSMFDKQPNDAKQIRKTNPMINNSVLVTTSDTLDHNNLPTTLL